MTGMIAVTTGMIFENGIVGTILVGVILLGIITLAVRSMILDKRNGKSLQCGCDCKHCSGQCGKSQLTSSMRKQ